MAVTLTNEGQDAQAATVMTANTGNWRIGLYTARGGSGRNVVLSDITFATFSGYSPGTPSFSVGSDTVAGRDLWTSASIPFAHNGGGTANTIIGACLYNSVTGKLHYYEDFGAPVTMSAVGNQIDVTPKWYYGELTPPL